MRAVSDECLHTKWQKPEVRQNKVLDGMEAADKRSEMGRRGREQRDRSDCSFALSPQMTVAVSHVAFTA